MGNLIKYGIYGVVINSVVSIFLYLMGKITLGFEMARMVEGGEPSHILPAHVFTLAIITAVVSLGVFEYLCRRKEDEEEAYKQFFYISLGVLVLSLVPVWGASFGSPVGTPVVLTLIHVAAAITLLSVAKAYQAKRH